MAKKRQTGLRYPWTQDEPMRGYQVRLTHWHMRKAKAIGNGNLGAGVRLAIELANARFSGVV